MLFRSLISVPVAAVLETSGAATGVCAAATLAARACKAAELSAVVAAALVPALGESLPVSAAVEESEDWPEELPSGLVASGSRLEKSAAAAVLPGFDSAPTAAFGFRMTTGLPAGFFTGEFFSAASRAGRARARFIILSNGSAGLAEER